MKGKIKLVVGLMFAASVAVQAAPIFVENFDGYDPSTDTTGSGSTVLGGQGQLEDVSTWSGLDTDAGNLQTRVVGTGDRNLNIYSRRDATQPQINSSTFTAQDQSAAFSFYFNLESWGVNNWYGRTEIGIRDSVSGNNVLGIDMLTQAKGNTTNMKVWLWDYTSGTRTNGGAGERTSVVNATTVGSIGLAYDGAGNILITAFGGADQTGASLRTITTTVDAANFSADSMYIKSSQGNTAKNRYMTIGVDDLTVIPEPATLGLIAVMAGGLIFVRRRIMM